MENLAPAGNREALEKAEAAGADAVYLGYAAFSARAGAGNFDRQELEEAIRFAHLRHMRVHVTVNTLVKDDELAEVTEVLRLLHDLQADAVLVQDLGVLRILKSLFPGMTIHASTQMAIHNRTGAAWCARQGMSRVVLARECSLVEIRRCADAGCEIEVFGHGAQCVAVSGMCLFSSMAGGRSGNRGRCAQPCRMEYTYRGKKGAWLSPRDVCLRDRLPELAAAGVASIKLEGRLKRPEYVSAVTASYRKGLDSLDRGAFEPADRAEKDQLLQAFNRGGFMEGYAMGCEDAGVIWPKAVNHQGLRLGIVTGTEGKLARVKLERELRNGDGLALRGSREEASLIYAGPDLEAGETAAVRLRPEIRAKAGDEVYRLASAAQAEEAEKREGRKVPVDLFLRAVPGEPLTLTAADGENRVTVTGEEVMPARTRAAEAEEVKKSLEKTGGTVFTLREARVETENAFVPVSALNGIRRRALDALAEERIRAFAPDTGTEGVWPEENLPEATVPDMAYVRTAAQAEQARQAGLRIVWQPEDYRQEALETLGAAMQPGEWLALPEKCEEETLQALRRWTKARRKTLGGVVLGSAGQLGIPWEVPYGAGSSIPVMNRQAASLLADEGCEFVTASPELTGSEIRALRGGNAPVVTVFYGRTQLMLLHHCPARTALGLRTGHRDCRMCDEQQPEALAGTALEDRMGYRFPLLRLRLPEGCLVRLMNALPTDNMDRKAGSGAVVFSTESREEAGEILAAFKEGKKGTEESTSGHWKREVE